MHLKTFRAAACALFLFVAGCSGPTAPTPPPPPPPPPEAPTVSCGSDISRSTVANTGLQVTYAAPTASQGQAPVTVSCSPDSGSTFPIGMTTVSCTATDALNRQASCQFRVTVSKLAQLSRLRYMAFGDSITAGEVTVPSSLGLTSGKLVLVPSASYPTVLERLLRTRYPAHNNDIIVVNQGVSGEKAAEARSRFQAALNSIRPDVVLLLHGHNDIPTGADGAASTAAFEVRMMAAEARVRGARVFLATPVPARASGFRAIDTFLLVDYANRMRAAASQEGAVLVDLYAAMLPDASRYIGVDGLHPTEAGYTRIAELFADAIQRELEVR